MFAIIGAGVLLFFTSFYLWHLNRTIAGIPDEVQKSSPHRWTPEEIEATYAKIVKDPISGSAHLPPKLERRYIIVGGSGERLHSTFSGPTDSNKTNTACYE